MSLITFKKVQTKDDINPIINKKLYLTKDSKILWIQFDTELEPFPGAGLVEIPEVEWEFLIQKITNINHLHGEYIKKRLYGDGTYNYLYADLNDTGITRYGGSECIPLPEVPYDLWNLLIEEIHSKDYLYPVYNKNHIYANKLNHFLYIDFDNNELVNYGSIEII